VTTLTDYNLLILSPTGEIERCLKKVSEGVETFEDIWQKVGGLVVLVFTLFFPELF